MQLPYALAIALLDIFPREMLPQNVHTKICTWMFYDSKKLETTQIHGWKVEL